MDILGMLEARLDFITRFYDSAVEPFETIIRKIGAHEEPFIPRCAPGDHDGPEYQAEYAEAEDCRQMVGHCALAYVVKALQDYLREFIVREAGVRGRQIEDVLQKGGKWLDRYERFLEAKTAFRWIDCPVERQRVQEIVQARNIILHDLSIDGSWPTQTERDTHTYTQGGAKPTFGDES